MMVLKNPTKSTSDATVPTIMNACKCDISKHGRVLAFLIMNLTN